MVNNPDPEKQLFEKYEPDSGAEFNPERLMSEEEAVQERTDDEGCVWKKVYFGSGSHFDNWFEQFGEVHGKENVEAEEVKEGVCKCYGEGGEIMKRIWVRERRLPK